MLSPIVVRRSRTFAWCWPLVTLVTLAPQLASADDAQWIWSPAYEKEQAPVGDCYFRKSFELTNPEQGEVQIAADDRYELFVNGRPVGTGENWKLLDVFDITKYLVSGKNVIAVKAANTDGNSAGLVARVIVKQHGGTHVSYSTDDTWRAALKEFPHWQKARFDDATWLAARAFGAVGATLPWGNEVSVAGASGRFKLLPDFHVEWVIDSKQTGSLIAMTFNEFGEIVAARENGPLVIVRDENKDGLPEVVHTYCDQVQGCQGLVTVSGKLYVVGQGPRGAGLYRLADEDQDGQIDQIDLLVRFGGEMGEHGPHALTLGPDGLLYLVVGNFSKCDKEFESTSPYRTIYEGDLVRPRYEDASGHAVGVPAPGGAILRTDTGGSAVELIAAGLQNPYDLAFNAEGELFTWDSDMEWDAGMPWYRPTRLVHVVPGGEFGWRSGWAKWPDYYPDSLPPIVETGRGSPTGLEVYNHVMFPKRYHNAIFMGDWSRGRILVVRPKPHGATYKATTETFLEGRPLNVTDLTVGPDGWLYFCTGGRDTEGGIYRVVWDGNVPEQEKQLGKGLSAALRQPQLGSAWARQRIALVKQQLGADWQPQLTRICEDARAPLAQRLRALDLLQLFGPHPAPALLVAVSRDKQPALRVKAARLMGLYPADDTTTRLIELLADADLSVQRAACESLVRAGAEPPVSKLLPLMESPDRHVSFAARRLLERIDPAQWQEAALAGKNRTFINGAIALLLANPNPEAAQEIVQRADKLLAGYLNDQDFLDLLRVLQLALLRGEIAPDAADGLRQTLAEEYPAQEPRMNRELLRLLVYLQSPTTAERLVEQLKADGEMPEKLHAALHARFLQVGWTLPLKLEMLKFFEQARGQQGGHSYLGMIENVSRDFFATFDDEERHAVLAQGAKWPSSALSVLARLPDALSPEAIEQIKQLDRQVKPLDTEAARRLRIGITAVLGASRDEAAMAYLRELFENEPDRRVAIAMGLAQSPADENWPLLLRSLSVVEGTAAQEVLLKLGQVERTPDTPEPYRQTILRGLLLRDNGSRHAIGLLEHWTGRQVSQPEDSWETALAAWQSWFVETYPDEPEPKLPTDSDRSQWTYQELQSYLTPAVLAEANARRGAAVFEKAQCIRCHRMGERGETIGPDLTNVAKRFQRKEILESILFPSQVISDQYVAQNIVTTDGRTLVGLVAPDGVDAIYILPTDGRKIRLRREQVQEISRSKQSSMPDELLNKLTLEEIADLFVYLGAGATTEVARKPGPPKR